MLSLWVSAQVNGYSSNRWATFKQWAAAGATVTVLIAPVDAVALASVSGLHAPPNSAIGGHANVWAIALNSAGTLLLAAPLACAAERPGPMELRARLAQVLRDLTVADAEAAWTAPLPTRVTREQVA